MRKLITILICLTTISSFGQSFVSPINFVSNEINNQKVIDFIEHQVKVDYTAIGMSDPMTLRMIEKENLKAFKELINITNIKLLESVIKTYCNIGMCNYVTILMMYKEQNKASEENLKW